MRSARRSGFGRRKTLAMASTVSAALILASCASDDAPDGEDVQSIRVADYYTDEPSRSIIGGMLETCGEAAGVQIEREDVPSSDYLSRVLQQSSSQTLPDIQMLDAQDVPPIAASGALAPLTERDVDTDAVGDSVRALGESDGELYGLAPTVGTVVMFYNVDLLEEAGVEPPTTFEEVRDAAAALTSDGTYGIAFSAMGDAQGTYAYLPLFWSAGGEEDQLDSEAARRALQFEVDLVEDGSASRSIVQWGNSDVGDQFAAGNAAMAITSATQMSKFDQDPTLSYEMVETPVPDEGDVAVAPLGGEVWTLPRTGEEGREAKAAEVLNCIVSDDTQLSLAVERRVVPGNPDLDEAYLEELPGLEAYVQLARNGRSRTALLGEDWPEANAAIWTAVQSAVTGQQSVEDALATAAGS